MKMFFARLLITLLFLTANFRAGNSQKIEMANLPYPEGFFTGLISGITEDPLGYLWFSAATGFFRYDGYNISIYRNQPSNPNSLASNRVECIYADHNGIIWLGTYGQGLDRFDPATETFTHYRNNAADPNSLNNDTITAILEDKEGILWVGTYGGLNRMNQKTGKFESYPNKVNDPGSLSCNQVRIIYEDAEGTIWVGTGSPFYETNTTGQGGLNKLDKKTGRFTRYFHDPKNPHSLVDNRVRAIFEDSKGTFWIGTAGDGLHTMDRSKNSFKRHLFEPDHPEKLSRPRLLEGIDGSDDHITFITEDATGAIWIGSFNGLNRFDPLTNKIKYYDSLTGATTPYKDASAWCAFNSHDGLLWMSSFYSGLYKMNPFNEQIPYFEIESSANSICSEAPGTYWIATSTEGLIFDDRINGKQQKYLHDRLNPSSISNDTVNAIRVNKEGKLWVATRNGLDLFNPQSGTFTHYKHDSTNNSSISSNHILSIYLDQEENLWIGTTAGLDYLNIKTGICKHYLYDPKDNNSIGLNFIVAILEDPEGNLWLGSYYKGGIRQLNRQTGEFKRFLKELSITSSFYRDSKGTIWTGTIDGLYRYNTASDNFTPYVDPDSVTTLNPVFNILEDSQQNLWIATSGDLIRLNPERNKTVLFGNSHGIHPNNFGYGDNGWGAGQEIFFGDGNGYYVFSPNSISVNPNPPKIHLAGFRISDELVQPGPNSAITQPLWKANDINLTYFEGIFSFEPFALQYINPDDVRLFYMLENYDESWRPSKKGQRAYYFNVPPGKYILKVKASNSNGVWEEKDITVTISPPWWRSWWAYCGYVLVLVASGWATNRYQKLKIIRAASEKAQKRELFQAKEIEKAYTELKATQAQLIQSEKMASLGELTAGIAHEIQNPLNFVNNFSEVNTELIEEMEQEIEKGNLDDVKAIAKDIKENELKINHHGKRADAIVKGMLQHSRASSGVKEPTDINTLADEYLRLAYHGLRAKDKSFNATMKTEFDETIGKINIVPQDIGRAILNLITNAFYAVTEKNKLQLEGYIPTVTVITKRLGHNIEIQVKDNGMGIPEKVKDKIFQPFFTTKPTGQGTGLGLSLSYDIVKAHGGEMAVESKEGEGSIFIVTLPNPSVIV